LAALTINAADSTISLTLKPNANIGDGYIFDIIYDIKDNGLPASQCAMGNLKITAYPLPVVSAKSTAICVGTNTILSPVTGGTWTCNNTGIATIKDNSVVTGVSSGTAILTFTSSVTGCSQTVNISVNTFPLAEEITGSHSVCIGDSVQLSNQTAGGVWMTNNANATISNPNANPVRIKGVSEGSAYVTYTVSNGICQTKRTYFLKIIPNVSPNIRIGIMK
jgi:hypothetical protein